MVVILVLFVIIVYHKFPSVLNIPPLSKPYSRTSSGSGAAERGITSNQYEYHTGLMISIFYCNVPTFYNQTIIINILASKSECAITNLTGEPCQG